MLDFRGVKLEIHPHNGILNKVRELVYKRGDLYKEVSTYDEEQLIEFIIYELTVQLNTAFAAGFVLGKLELYPKE